MSLCMLSFCIFVKENESQVQEVLKRSSVFAFQTADVPKPVSAPGPVLKANSLSNLEQEKSTYRYVVLITMPQAAEKVGEGQVVRSLQRRRSSFIVA